MNYAILSIISPMKLFNVNDKEYHVRQRGCSFTHSARNPPAVNPGIKIWLKLRKKGKNLFFNEIEFEKKLFVEIIFFGRGIFYLGSWPIF